MEARQTLRGNAVPKGLMVVLAICAAIALAAIGVGMSKSFGASGTAVPSVGHPAAGTVLRQDNPVQASSLIDRAAPVGGQAGRRGGPQTDDTYFGLTAGDGGGYQSDLTRALPSEVQAEPRSTGHGQLP